LTIYKWQTGKACGALANQSSARLARDAAELSCDGGSANVKLGLSTSDFVEELENGIDAGGDA
jgi:hypothetical protein